MHFQCHGSERHSEPSTRNLRPRARYWIFACLVATFACSHDATGPCADASGTAIQLTILDGISSQPVSVNVTVIYDRHGDDSLTLINTRPTRTPIALGSRPGIYDFRVIAPGYVDWLTTNQVVNANGCQTATIGMMVFMQPTL
jgi:hypothetical protein